MKKIALVSSRGGHLGQIKLIFNVDVIGNNKAILITESEDLAKVNSYENQGFLKKYKVYFFQKDYLGFNPFRYLSFIFKMVKIFRREKIDIVITNGAQISIPAVIAGKMTRAKSIFIDTIIRVNTPNWSARACYYFSDMFLVQHLAMAKKYGRKAFFAGSVI